MVERNYTKLNGYDLTDVEKKLIAIISEQTDMALLNGYDPLKRTIGQNLYPYKKYEYNLGDGSGNSAYMVATSKENQQETENSLVILKDDVKVVSSRFSSSFLRALDAEYKIQSDNIAKYEANKEKNLGQEGMKNFLETRDDNIKVASIISATSHIMDGAVHAQTHHPHILHIASSILHSAHHISGYNHDGYSQEKSEGLSEDVSKLLTPHMTQKDIESPGMNM